MRRTASFLLGAFFLFSGLGIAMAQEQSEGTMPPPKVLAIYREFLKPGKAGGPHEKTESAFVQAVTQAKWPEHYLAVDSLSGRPRSLFLYGYDSFAAWEKDGQAQEKNATLSAALARASLADGELLSETESSVFIFREDQSLRAPVDIAHMRYFEISIYMVRPGHAHEWDELVKLVKAAYEKIPDAHWAMYEEAYGQGGSEYLVFTPMKSAAEIDAGFARDKEFVANMGEDGMKKLSEMESSAVESRQSNLFMFNPKTSYPREEWIKADPDFWKPKASMPMHMPKKGMEKPAGAQ
jgi:hypothetical protein